jgi:methylated-DNA-[protein]-cysteine S-methyltransferase
VLYSSLYSSPIGWLTLASDGENLTGLWMEDQKYFGSTIKGDIIEKDELKVFALVKNWLNRYFAGEKPDLAALSLAPQGSEFRQNVWKLLCEIPYGETTTYGRLGEKMAVLLDRERVPARAIGGAVGHNPISIIIPCHRVVGSTGSLTGYAGGLEKKIKLLELEGVVFSL